jgi:protoporphyrin/coproporphyrin ferrochelatase
MRSLCVRQRRARRVRMVGACAARSVCTAFRYNRCLALAISFFSAPSMAYLPEPAFTHGSAQRIGILLVNLGTPEAPTPGAVRAYLREFLSDPRVVEIPRALWMLILHGIILRTRPRKSAEKYAKVWTGEGSPLRTITAQQTKLLRGYLGNLHGAQIIVEYGMRYGIPSIAQGVEALKRQHCDRLLLLPAYPQYAASTTASACDALFDELKRVRSMPALRVVRQYHDHPGYIAALANNVRNYWMKNGRGQMLVMSFHGLPRFALDKGDPYHCQCHKTARLLAESLGLTEQQYVVAFQSRFGRAKWLEPYTQPTLEKLGKQRIGRVDVVCPGFVADCLETLEEINMECRAAFLASGGQEFHYVPCLNDRPDWIQALATIAGEHLHGWLDAAPNAERAASEAAASKRRALALGARA